MRAIYADDSLIMRDRMKQYLKMSDLEIVGSADSGDAALELCKKVKPDLAVLDILMPPGGGKEAALELMSSKLVPYVVVVTSNSQDSNIKPLRAAGVRTLTKPLSAEQAEQEFRAIVVEFERGA